MYASNNKYESELVMSSPLALGFAAINRQAKSHLTRGGKPYQMTPVEIRQLIEDIMG